MKWPYFFFFSVGLILGVTIAFQKHKNIPLNIPFKPIQDHSINHQINSKSLDENYSVIDSFPKKGRRKFLFSCSSCHHKNMKDDLTGPALGGVRQRWEGRETLLYEFIRNSQKVIKEGKDEYVVNLYKEWRSIMNNYPNLSDEDIDDLLDYVDYIYAKE